MPIEPHPSAWQLPAADSVDPLEDFVGIGADLEPGTLLAGYRNGIFFMPLHDVDGLPEGLAPIGWWSPDPRGILPLDDMHISRTLRRAFRRYEIRVDSAFDYVVAACGDPARPHGWIDDPVRAAYGRLYELGWAHSVEAWSVDDGELCGGLFGIGINGLFAAESMFHFRTDASKVAVAALVRLLQQHEYSLLDVQWSTPHLASLGVVELSRTEYLERLTSALDRPTQPIGPLEHPLRLQPFA